MESFEYLSHALKFYYGWKAPIPLHWNSIIHLKEFIEHLLCATQGTRSLGYNSESEND